MDNQWTPSSPWDVHPIFDVSDWRQEIARNDTRLGYVDWVNHQLFIADEIDNPPNPYPTNLYFAFITADQLSRISGHVVVEAESVDGACEKIADPTKWFLFDPTGDEPQEIYDVEYDEVTQRYTDHTERKVWPES